MPKVSSDSSIKQAGDQASMPILKRNQACHQCRRRKLSYESDARRPCSTCVRSHRNTLAHAAAGVEAPPLECTFDEALESGAQSHPAPKNRYERLENRISELEALLRQKEEESNRSRASISPSTSSVSLLPSGLGQQALASLTNGSDSFNQTFLYIQPPPKSISPQATAHISPVSTPPLAFPVNAKNGRNQEGQSNAVLWSNWPHNLPAADLLQHLVEVFFSFHPHAGRIFHTPTFLASLSLPPHHANFPHVAILHAICAVGSFYTLAVEPAPLPNFAETPADDIFQNAYKRRKAVPDSFAELQAKYGIEALSESTNLGERLFECQQALTILTWFFHAHARWADMFLTTGRAMRHLIPLGLNMCPPFHSISKSLRAPSIIPPARTVIEDETRRNTFWLTYATERFYSSGNGWAMSLDDQDISQLLPVRSDQFEQGVLVPPTNRQWAHTPDMLLTHPAEQTDSFVLYVKASIVLSHVKTFNLRFRAKHFAGDPEMLSPDSSRNEPCATAQYVDPRDSPGFIKVDRLVESFIPSFPKRFKSATQNGVVDLHLLVAFLAPSVAKILLHDPHVELKRKGCISVQRILEAARAILDQLYAIWSTSFDLTLLDSFCCFAFFMAGRVLTRFLQEAKDIRNQPQIQTVRTELEYIRIALAKSGLRIPLAYRYAKMLDDIILQSVGLLEDVVLLNFQNPSFPTNPQYSTLPSENSSQDSLSFFMGVGAPSFFDF